MKLTIGIVIAVIAIGGLVAIFVINNNDDTATNTATSTSTSTTVQVDSNQTTEQLNLTVEEVAKHNTESDCWTIINGAVYDLTSFISGHQGGSEILRACGIDGSSLFNERETSEGEEIGSGTSHSSRAEGILSGLRLGELQN